jgi:glycosyltransferase involved in cell wall biosynthesis
MTSNVELVTVVIPAYNAAATIGETIRSVQAQTHARLEILIVDDGSIDATAEIVQSHMASDARIRLLRQANGGVASARNLGWKQAAAELIAFVDSDDLWSADKIEKQLAVLRKGCDSVALVYTWFAVLDMAGFVVRNHYSAAAGEVLEELLEKNFIGNASSVLIRKAALCAVGGYDPGLRAQRGEGCEDLLLYLRLAERYEFAVVPECLTGYRLTPGSMSSNLMQMLRSSRLVAAEMCSRHPQHRRIVAQGLANYVRFLLGQAIRSRRPFDVARLGLTLLLRRPDLATRALLIDPSQWLLRKVRRTLRQKRAGVAPSAPKPSRFEIGNPDATR